MGWAEREREDTAREAAAAQQVQHRVAQLAHEAEAEAEVAAEPWSTALGMEREHMARVATKTKPTAEALGKGKLYRRREGAREDTARWCGRCVEGGVTLERQLEGTQVHVDRLRAQVASQQVSRSGRVSVSGCQWSRFRASCGVRKERARGKVVVGRTNRQPGEGWQPLYHTRRTT